MLREAQQASREVILRTPGLRKEARGGANHPNAVVANQSTIRPNNSAGELGKDDTLRSFKEIYGKYITTKQNGLLRIGFQNFNGFTGKANDPVDDSLRKWITEWDFDIFGISEVNMYWPAVKQELQFKERMREWWNPLLVRSVHAFNTHEKNRRSIRQYGGTAQIARGNATLKYQASGADPRGLGRWVWQLYRGKNNKTLRVITAYRPIAKGISAPYAVYTQHRTYFNNIGKTSFEPRQTLLDDLAKAIGQWKKEGDHVVLMMDCNDNLTGKDMTDFLKRVRMRDILVERYQGNPPNTHIDGKQPIDGIFATNGVTIEGGGYTAFDDGVQGHRPDHRCLWFDVKISSVLGHGMPSPMKFAGRRVKTKDPRVSKRFNESYKKFAIKTGLSKKIFQLERQAVYPLPPYLQTTAEQIADLRYQGIAHADKKCRKIFKGETAYSPQYKRHSSAVKFWNYIIRMKEGANVKSRWIQRLARKAGIKMQLKDIMALDLQVIIQQSKNTYHKFRKFSKNADIVRDTWLQDLATARAEEELRRRENKDMLGKPPKQRKKMTKKRATANEIQQLRAQEASRSMFRRIGYAIGKENLAGISLVSAPQGEDEQGNQIWKDVSSHKDIVDVLITEHQKKYHQTENTPPMRFPLRQQLGYLGIGKECDKILNNKYTKLPGTDQYSAKLLQKLSRVDSTATELPIGISGKEYSQGWKRAKERTSAGGNILHFGHCKSMAHDSQLSDMEAAFLSIPLRSGYTFQQWRKGVDCVLPKKANSFRVDKLRTIVLLEADFNFINKLIARKTAKRAESYHDGFAEEQFGSRKGHRAIDHALNKELTLDLIRQFKIPGVLVPNDLKSCYDRICHSIASLCMRRQGVAESEVVCMFSTLQHLEHTIRCAYGDSTQTYGSDIWALPMQGVYQGNGAGPVIWAVVSSPVLQIMKESGYGTFFKTAITGQDIRLVGYAFVDDTDLIQTARHPTDTIESVIEEMQKGMDLWEGLISATGGALSVEKCRWWAIDFLWKEDGTWRYKTMEETPGNLYAIDFDGTRQTIERLDTSTAFETLGVFLAPDGNQKAALNKLIDKANEWADKLRTSHLREQETATALKATILKTLEYPLLTLHLSEDECNQIMRPILNAALPKAKFNRHFCRRTLYGPGSHLGAEIHKLHTSQILSHVDGLLRHGPNDSLTGKLLRGSIEAAKVELGLTGDLFSHSFKEYGHLITDGWVKRTWEELYKANIEVIECTQHLLPQRENDVILMERFRQLRFKGIDLARLNRCRLYLRLYSLADICKPDGRYVLLQYFDGTNPMPQRSELSWPNQGNPNPTIWRLWKRALKLAFPHDRTGRLFIHHPGRWINPPTMSWTARHDTQLHRTYIKDDNQWRCFQHFPRTIHGVQPPTEIPNAAPGPQSLRAIAWIDDEDNLIYHGTCGQREHSMGPTTLPQALDALETEYKWSVEYYKMPPNIQSLATAMADGSAIAVTDGSFKAERGTSGFCITESDGTNRFMGANVAPGHEDDHCSYRSELVGILGIIQVCKLICKLYNITTGAVEIGCDNLDAGRHAIEYERPPNPSDNHYDVLQAIFALRKETPIVFTYRHVEGHQKEKYPHRQLDIWAKLNDRMDSLAKAYWHYTSQRAKTPCSPLMPREWRVYFRGVKISTNITTALRHRIEGDRMESKWTQQRKRKRRVLPPMFTEEQIQLMDLKAIQHAWNNIQGNRKRFVTKLASNFLPVGRNMQRMKFWPTNKCPCCLLNDETCPHLFLCQDPRARQCRMSAINTFRHGLRRSKTHPMIERALIKLLEHTLMGEAIRVDQEYAEVEAAVKDQLILGGHQLLMGRVVKKWALLQQKAFLNYAPWLNGKSWASSTIRLLWELSFSIWEHRNNILHRSEALDTVLDMDSIDLQILEEWQLGTEDLVEIDHSYFRGITIEGLLEKSGSYRRQWLRGVLAARSPGRQEENLSQDLDNAELFPLPPLLNPTDE